MGKYSIFILFPLFLSCERLLDEKKPKAPENFRGIFTLFNNKPIVRLAWNETYEDDVEEFHIFRSDDHISPFYSIGSINNPNVSFIDTTINWQEGFWYKIRSKDYSTNIGDFSDSIYILCYKPIGKWSIEGYDSTEICVDPKTYSTNELLSLSTNTNLESINDTSWTLEFPKITIDTVGWFGNGMMHYSYMTLENSSDGIGFDTVTYSNTISPTPFTFDFSVMNEGRIIIGFENQEVINLQHQKILCDSNQINFFP
ncbi:MAG: hypothetical protein CMG60_08305 [Candidatus Marinimicrobia bacterium]|nr:hypothetical protein [Candidatus Neomarinimicrobiota bacterium]